MRLKAHYNMTKLTIHCSKNQKQLGTNSPSRFSFEIHK